MNEKDWIPVPKGVIKDAVQLPHFKDRVLLRLSDTYFEVGRLARYEFTSDGINVYWDHNEVYDDHTPTHYMIIVPPKTES